MKVINAHTAGIDVGSRSHMVAVDQIPEHVREFGVYTSDHEESIAYLHDHRIATVAMESTWSYWQTLFNVLQRANFEVLLVNSKHTKNIKGKKTEVIDCMCIQKTSQFGTVKWQLSFK